VSQPSRHQKEHELRGFFEGRFRAVPEQGPPLERRFRVPVSTIDRAASALGREGGRFVSLFVAERPNRSLVALYALRGELVVLRASLSENAQAYASLSIESPAALWAERELHDVEQVVPVGHPELDRITRPDPDVWRRRVSGPDAFVIPYGPIRSGVFEAIQFIIETGGEDILSLQVRPLFKRRGLESRFVGLTFDHAVYLAERVAGVASVGHALAFSQAVERALGVEPPLRAALWRTVLAELERIANHLDVAARLAEDPALAVGQARLAILKEDVLRLQAQMTGSRFSRGVVVPGGVRAEPSLGLDELLGALDALERNLARDRRLLLRTTSFTDRLIGSGGLDRATVASFGGVGPIARAVGLAIDARFERPYAAYGRLGFEVVTREPGDAMARLEVRLGEIGQSLHLLRQALDRLRRERGPLVAPLSEESGEACGWAEAPQGELVYWVEVAGGTVQRVRIASPSFRNWPLFRESFRGDVLTDFAFIEHSFGVTPAGTDR
jgi:formate hydrogenlyase subunit 5